MYNARNFFTVLLFCCAVFSLYARDVTIFVEDTELALPLEGAVIRSWDSAQYTCDTDGKAVVSVPDDRQVVIQAAYPGYENGRLVIPPEGEQFTMGLRLSGIMENRELVIEAAKPGVSETKTGRSVAVSGQDIAQTGEIGLIEDVMSSVKLLSGVGYTGYLNAQPSIRGGDPEDLRASLDGFYVFNPYHLGGTFSIFDPRMVESAQLSHGVFSSRHGHTISGLLDVTTKKPSPTETEFELGISTIAANFNLSLPLFGRGGILIMGKVTYYEPIQFLTKQFAQSDERKEMLNAIRVGPYVRSGTITGNYRFFDNLELQATGFWGMDGLGATFENSSDINGLKSDSSIISDFTNYQGFITAGLSWNPRNDMLVKLTAGTGYQDYIIEGDISDTIHEKKFSDDLLNKYGALMGLDFKDTYNHKSYLTLTEDDFGFTAQGRLDYDWELGRGFLLSAGIQEMFTRYKTTSNQVLEMERAFSDLPAGDQAAIQGQLPSIPAGMLNNMFVAFPGKFTSNVDNSQFVTSGYILSEYHTPEERFSAELGLRVDHFYLANNDNDFSIQSKPALNPRLNIDFNVFKNKGIVQSWDLNAGTGLFSSVNKISLLADKQYGITEMKPNRSWTSVLGTNLELSEGLSLNIEGYYKHIFDRMYIPAYSGWNDLIPDPQFNGEGRVWGIDVLLRKMQSRYWDGWISYSFNWAKDRNPNEKMYSHTEGNDWHFPSYHRFHNLNLVLNIKPTQSINIYARFGLASGIQQERRLGDGPESYPVYIYNTENPANSYFIEKYYWDSERDENNRTTLSLPLDIKFSIYGSNPTGKVRYETYIAFENVLALLYTAQGNTTFNSYTGEINNGSTAASYEFPIPIPSVGLKISY